MNQRKNQIKFWITRRINNNETGFCTLQILLLKEESKGIVEDLLKRNGWKGYPVDSICGCWNLDDEWYELSDVEAIGEYCGVYPVKWDIEDVVLLERLYTNRDIYINVMWKQKCEDGEIDYVPNH